MRRKKGWTNSSNHRCNGCRSRNRKVTDSNSFRTATAATTSSGTAEVEAAAAGDEVVFAVAELPTTTGETRETSAVVVMATR